MPHTWKRRKRKPDTQVAALPTVGGAAAVLLRTTLLTSIKLGVPVTGRLLSLTQSMPKAALERNDVWAHWDKEASLLSFREIRDLCTSIAVQLTTENYGSIITINPGSPGPSPSSEPTRTGKEEGA